MSFLVEAASAAYGETCHYRRPTGGDLALKSLKLSMGLFGHHLLASSGFCWLSCYLPPQPAIPAVIDRSLGIAKEPANSGLLGLGPLSPRAHFLVLGRQITKGLRPTPRIFPFSGDGGRRLGSTATGWQGRRPRVGDEVLGVCDVGGRPMQQRRSVHQSPPCGSTSPWPAGPSH